jgi:rubrerythrin
VSEKVGAAVVETVPDDGFVDFYAAGETVAGEFRCSRCGYGVSVRRALPMCPMCGGRAWEPWRS